MDINICLTGGLKKQCPDGLVVTLQKQLTNKISVISFKIFIGLPSQGFTTRHILSSLALARFAIASRTKTS